MEDHLQMNEMTHLNLPERDRSRSASPADSLTSSATDISMLPIAGRSSHKRDDYVSPCSLLSLIAIEQNMQHYD
ncbi:uncharacterized protein TNCV_3397801 [Trichonephila clavipes]|nr:uncharacterized protein TNCV_3397801 [Trichonephila clavipes]